MTVTARRPLTAQQIENPGDGVRLELMPLCAHLDVTFAALADACGISRSSMSRIASHNQWPSGRDRAELQQLIREHLATAGATPEMLAIAFHAFAGRHFWTAPDLEKHAAYQAQLAAAAAAKTANQPDPNEEETMLLPKQTLSPEAKRHFRTLINPFDGEVTTDEQMYVGGEVSYVREACWQCAVTASFVAVVGESGAGKTTILGDLEARIAQEARHAIVIKPSVLGMEETDRRGKTMKSTDILHAVITALDPGATVPQTLQARTKKAQAMLTASADAGNSHLLVIEEAHSLPDATLKHLKRMHEMRQGRKPLMGILLLGQQELKHRLDAGLRGGHLREVAQRCELVQILPLDGELGPYLEKRAGAVGRRLGDFLGPDAIDALRSKLTRSVAGAGKARVVSLSYPLAVNNLVTRALNEAASIGVPLVNREVIQSI